MVIDLFKKVHNATFWQTAQHHGDYANILNLTCSSTVISNGKSEPVKTNLA
jgi:hypothetical protein